MGGGPSPDTGEGGGSCAEGWATVFPAGSPRTFSLRGTERAEAWKSRRKALRPQSDQQLSVDGACLTPHVSPGSGTPGEMALLSLQRPGQVVETPSPRWGPPQLPLPAARAGLSVFLKAQVAAHTPGSHMASCSPAGGPSAGLDPKAPVRGDRWALSLGSGGQRPRAPGSLPRGAQGKASRQVRGTGSGADPRGRRRHLQVQGWGRGGAAGAWGGGGGPPSARPGGSSFTLSAPFQFPPHPCPRDTFSLQTRADLTAT